MSDIEIYERLGCELTIDEKHPDGEGGRTAGYYKLEVKIHFTEDNSQEAFALLDEVIAKARMINQFPLHLSESDFEPDSLRR